MHRCKCQLYLLPCDGGVAVRPVSDVMFINNTVYGNGNSEWGGGIYLENPDAENIIVCNNIFSQNELFQIAHEINLVKQNITIDYNLIDGFRDENKTKE